MPDPQLPEPEVPNTVERPDRTLPIILGVIGVLVVVAALVVFTRGGPARLDPATPEGAVQAYASAVIDGDLDTAVSLLSPSWREGCDPRQYGPTDSQLSVTLISTTERGDSATVRVSLSYGPGDDPFGSGYEQKDLFRLQKQGGEWLVSEAPWSLSLCPAGGA